MEERLKFIARLLDGEKMAVLCREFDISRKTGYKILTRYNDSGLEGLTDRSRRPYRHANQLPFQIEKLIVRLKQDKPTWGAPKIRERLARLYPDVHRPAISTVHAVLRPPWPGRAPQAKAQQGDGNTTFKRLSAQRSVVCRLQRRVHARRSALLLPADDHRLRQPLSHRLRGVVDYQGSLCLHGVRERFQRVRPAQRHQDRQRRSLCQPKRAVQSQQTVGLVAAPGHRHRAHPAGLSAAERAP